ncbi:hypothetical protein D1BOALGB6SA_4766 [Olavius sp. associated proteobacterium Delta 1]|nr:hypothetical protein D1BOALGB6SA_4766 [Olavius sp. associated proteobacterium Delta 1]
MSVKAFFMKSKISKAVALKHQPVALIWSDQKPDGAVQFKERKWGCIMWLAASAARGKVAVCDRQTFGCFGGGIGMGFGDQYKNFPGGEECFCHFLSSGNDQWEQGRQTAAQVKPFLTAEAHDNFVHGERYMKSPEQVKKFIECLPITDIPTTYVAFKPLSEVDPAQEKPQVVIFFADPDQLSALVVLANYDRGDNQNVIMPYAAGCQTIGIYPYQEARAETPRAVVGLTDLSARVYIRKQLGDNLMSFAAPLSLFKEMEANVSGSFLERPTWQSLVKTK